MLVQSVRRVPSRRLSSVKHRGCCSQTSAGGSDAVRALLQLCEDRFFISPGPGNLDLFRRGSSCSYGPLGKELRRNLLDRWWHSVTGSRTQVFGVNTLSSTLDPGATGGLRVIESERLKRILEQQKLSRDQLVQEVHGLLQRSPSLRTNLFEGEEKHKTSVICK